MQVLCRPIYRCKQMQKQTDADADARHMKIVRCGKGETWGESSNAPVVGTAPYSELAPYPVWVGVTCEYRYMAWLLQRVCLHRRAHMQFLCHTIRQRCTCKFHTRTCTCNVRAISQTQAREYGMNVAGRMNGIVERFNTLLTKSRWHYVNSSEKLDSLSEKLDKGFIQWFQHVTARQ
jgi:hypothetical protein